jgi:hypothetical protein
VKVVAVPLRLTRKRLMLGTADFGIVTFANAAVPFWPVAVKLMEVAEEETLEIVASLEIELVHPVPQPVVVVEATV